MKQQHFGGQVSAVLLGGAGGQLRQKQQKGLRI